VMGARGYLATPIERALKYFSDAGQPGVDRARSARI
jgi:hypothetical protein